MQRLCKYSVKKSTTVTDKNVQGKSKKRTHKTELQQLDCVTVNTGRREKGTSR